MNEFFNKIKANQDKISQVAEDHYAQFQVSTRSPTLITPPLGQANFHQLLQKNNIKNNIRTNFKFNRQAVKDFLKLRIKKHKKNKLHDLPNFPVAQDIEDKIKNVRVSFFDIPSATDLGELARSVGQAMAIGADLLRRVIEAFFDISGLGFVKRLIEMGANFRGHKSLQKRRGFVHGNGDDFLLSAITFFRRSVWFMAFSSIYLVSPVLGAITVRTHSSF